MSSFASFVLPASNQQVKIKFDFRSAHPQADLMQLPLLLDGVLRLELKDFKLIMSLMIGQERKWSIGLTCQADAATEWNTAIVQLVPGEQPEFQCNGRSKSLTRAKNQFSYDLSGLANLGSSMTAGVSSSPIPPEICFRHIEINDVRKTVGDIVLSSKLTLGCPTARNIFSPTPSSEPTTTSSAIPLVRKTLDLMVDEGQRKNFKDLVPVLYEGEVMSFDIIEAPLHGKIIDSSNTIIEEFSSANNQVTYYANDGGESPNDRFAYRNKENTIEYLVNVTVKLVNDPPLFTNRDQLFQPLIGYANQLSSEFIALTDDDTDPDKVKIVNLGRYQPPDGEEHTYFFNAKNPSKEISAFKLSELNQGNIYVYQNHDPVKYRLIFKATDGSKYSNLRLLHTEPKHLQINQAKREQVRVRQGSSVIITNSHLEYETNADTVTNATITYEVVEIPELGDLMIKRNNEWELAELFTQADINQGRVKYIQQNTKKNVKHDSVLLGITVPGSNVTSDVTLDIEIIKIIFELSTDSLTIQDGLTDKHSFGVSIKTSSVENRARPNDNDITLAFPNELQYSDMYTANGTRVNSTMRFELSQLNQLGIYLKLKKEIQVVTSEQLWIALRSKTSGEETQAPILLHYRPDPAKVFVINTGLEVAEGKKTLIKREHLYASNMNADRLELELTAAPRHGVLRMINFNNRQASAANITRIKMEDIEQQRLFYEHDDTETQLDEFKFIVRNIDVDSHGISEEMSFKINIMLKNDNKPIRVNDRVLTVVTNGMKTITKSDVWFTDADSDSDDKDIRISWRGINNGDILNKTTREVIHEATQGDILAKEVIFRHRGLSYDQFVFWAKDATHSEPHVMRVQSGPPLIAVDVGAKFSVQKDGMAELTRRNMSLSTNLNIDPADVNWFLVDEPKRGEIQVNGQPVRQWQNGDVLAGKVTYKHMSKEPVYSDSFIIKAYHDRLESSEQKVDVKYYMENYQLPMKVSKQHRLVVNESGRVAFDKNTLLVTHASATPSEISFSVTTKPLFGEIVDINGRPVNNFTQSDVIHQNVFYENSKASMVDVFELNVTNFFTSIPNLKMSVEVIPRELPLRTNDVRVDEGESVSLSDAFKTASLENINHNFTVRIVQPCLYGKLRLLGGKKDIKKFTFANRHNVLYLHDGSENHIDKCIVQAIPIKNDDFHIRSDNQTINILVNPVNDQPPQLVNNVVLVVWQNSVTSITSNDLSYSDNDTNSDQLLYDINPPSGGHLAMKRAPDRKIHRFTQRDIDRGNLVFVANSAHTDAQRGGFNFEVSDGEHTSDRARFEVELRRLEIALTTSSKFKAHPGERIKLTQSDLWASTNDRERNRTITFTVERSAEHGNVVNPAGNVMSKFTQHDILNGQVFFQPHEEIPEWSSIDFFTFTASSSPARTLSHQSFYIQITYERDDGVSLAALEPLQVIEGGSIIITSRQVDASNFYKKIPHGLSHADFDLTFKLAQPPRYGKLLMSGRRMSPGYDFSQEDLNKNRIKYVHDHSDTKQDFIGIETSLMDLRRENAPNLIDARFNITVDIDGINDNKPELRDKNKLIQLINGIPNKIELDLVDKDGDVVNVTIISPSDLGTFVKGKNSTTKIDHFTNVDDDIYFVPGENVQLDKPGLMTISFTDGGTPAYEPLRLILRRLTLTLESPGVIHVRQGQFAVELTEHHMNVTTNGYVSDVNCEITVPPESGHLMRKGAKVKTFNAVDFLNGEVVLIIENTKMVKDLIAITCTNKDVTESIELDLLVVSAIRTNPPDSFALNPTAPTAFNGDTNLNLNHLREFFPLLFVPKQNEYVQFLRIRNARLRREEMATNATDVEEDIDVTWNGYHFTPVQNFTTELMNDVFVNVVKKPDKAEDKIRITVDVGASGIPTIPLIFDAHIASQNNHTLLPYFGLTLNEIAPDNDLAVNETLANSTAKTTTDSNANSIMDEKERKSDSDNRDLAPISDTDNENGDDNDDIQSAGLLLYIIPSAIIFLILLIFVVVVIFTRRLRAKEKRSRYGSNHTSSRSDIIKTEEGEKSTTYIIPAATDSTVKVTVQQSRYEHLLPTTTVKALPPDESVYGGGSSDDGGHTAYAGSNYFGVLSMSQPYSESRIEGEFEDESIGTVVLTEITNYTFNIKLRIR